VSFHSGDPYSNTEAENRFDHYSITGIPCHVYDGGYRGATGYIDENMINASGVRQIHRLEMSLSKSIAGSTLSFSGTVANPESHSFNGFMLVFITENQLIDPTYGITWNFVFRAYGLNRTLSLAPSVSTAFSGTWSIQSNVIPSNIQVIAAVYDTDTRDPTYGWPYAVQSVCDICSRSGAAAFDFSLSNSGGVTVMQGSSGSNMITVTLTGGTTQTVALSASGLPSGASSSFSPPSGNPTFTSTCTITTSTSTPPGSYTITVTGIGGGLTRTTIFALTVNPQAGFDFSISNSGGITVTQSSSGSNTITLTLVSGSTQSVSLSASGLPSGVSASFNPPSGNPTFTSTCTITTSTSTPPGSYTITVTGIGGGKTHTTTFTLTVQTGANFTIAVTPDSQTVNRGSSQTFTVAITSVGGFSKAVHLSLSGHQTGVTYDFNPDPVTLQAGQSATSTLTVYASSTATMETRTLTITASAPDPGITRTDTVSLTVAGKTDTAISCSLSATTIRQGEHVTISGSITPNPGANRNVVIEYSADGGSTWNTIATAQTASNGSFSYAWAPGQGSYKVKARWDGSEAYNGATSSQQSLTVQPIMPSCIIATATYGSELSPEVRFLRSFRDEAVMSTFAGSEFMKVFNAWYYSFSPHIADFISKQPLLKEAVKMLLYPLIGILYISASTSSALSFNPELAIVVAGLVASGLIGIIYLAPLSLITLLCMQWHRKFRLNPSHLKGLTATWIASIALIFLAEVTATQPVMMVATSMLVLSTLTLTALTTTQRIIQKLT